MGGIYQADVEDRFKHDGQASKNLAMGGCYASKVEQTGVVEGRWSACKRSYM